MVTLVPDSPASTLKCWGYSPGYHTQISYGILKSSVLLVQPSLIKLRLETGILRRVSSLPGLMRNIKSGAFPVVSLLVSTA